MDEIIEEIVEFFRSLAVALGVSLYLLFWLALGVIVFYTAWSVLTQ